MNNLLLITIAAFIVSCGSKPSDINIHDAAYEGNSLVVKEWIDQGVDINSEDIDGWTVLDCALCSKNEELIAFVKNSGGQSNANKSIFIASGVGDLEAVKKHVNAGINVNSKDADGWTPLFYAYDQINVAEFLISEGAKLNVLDNDEWTPLDHAIDSNDHAVIDLLRKNGGKTREGLINAVIIKDSSINKPDISIQKAAKDGDIAVVKNHIEIGTDVNEKDNYGRPPLYHAIWNDHTEIAKLLISKGAILNTEQPKIFNALYSAAGGNAGKETIELLITNGADLNFIRERGGNKGDETPLDRATRKGRTEIAELLRTHGAKTSKELKAEDE